MTKSDKEKDIMARVIASINETFGSDISSLGKAGGQIKNLEDRLRDIERKLDHANSVSHELQDLLNSGDELEQKVSGLVQQQESILDSASQAADESRIFQEENCEILDDIACVRGVTQYTIWLRLIEQINLDLSLSLETSDKEQIILAYSKLQEVANSLASSKCRHLLNYVEATQKHWYDHLTETYTTSLQDSLADFKWPFIEKSESIVTKADIAKIGKNEVEALQAAIEILYRIQKRSQKDNSGVSDAAVDADSVNLPMRIMMKPLRRRFKYHFLKNKSTNNPAKPEWFISQLTAWAAAHRCFLTEYIQPVYDAVGEPLMAVMEFGQGLVAMAAEKLEVDLPIVLADDILLAHTIDEIIGFARDLASSMQYSRSQPSALAPLTVSPIFGRWLNMERKFAFEKVDSLFMEQQGNGGGSVWESEVGDILTPRAAETFLALLLSVTERYKFLPVANSRLDFLRLQIELIEDFRLRLVQLVRAEKESPLSSNLCPIINTLDHMSSVLATWAETPFFLQLQHQRVNMAAAVNDERLDVKADGESVTNTDVIDSTVFSISLEELKYLKLTLVDEVVNAIFYTVTARSQRFRTETKWFKMADSGAAGVMAVSSAFCDMLQSLAFGLDTAKRRINVASFQLLWKQLAARLHTFILEEVILQNKFCVEGACQLRHDIHTGLFPLFAEFTKSPRSYFRDLDDVLRLLTSAPAPLRLVAEALAEACEDGANNILAEVGVTQLTPERAARVIRLRIDLQL